MDLELKDKCVLVQGASSGIGFAIAKEFAHAGAKVAISSSNVDRIHHASRQIRESIPFVCDFQKPKAGQALIWQVIERLGKIDILVTNTGNPMKAPFEKLKTEDWDLGYHSVFMSAIDSISEAIHSMKKNHFGRIIMCSSTAAKEPVDDLTLSSSFRSGLLGMMKLLSREVASSGITINAILPGFVKTSKLVERFKDDIHKFESMIPMKRLGDPEELAKLATFLSSKHAGYITGQAICFDGGLTRGY